MTTTYRAPQSRHVGDGVYASYDGDHIMLQTSNGIVSRDRIVLEPGGLRQIEDYAHYVGAFHRAGEHRVPPGCESCGCDLSAPDNPVDGAIRAEVYRVQDGPHSREIRLCKDCARTVDEPFLNRLVARRHDSSATDGEDTGERSGRPPDSYDFDWGMSLLATMVRRTWDTHRRPEQPLWDELSVAEKQAAAEQVGGFIENEMANSFELA